MVCVCSVQVVNCQRSLMQMEAGGSLATPTWQPLGTATPVYGNSTGGADPSVGGGSARDAAMAAAGVGGAVQLSHVGNGAAAAAALDQPGL